MMPVSVAWPNVVANAASAASRPAPICTKSLMSASLVASNKIQPPSGNASKNPRKSGGSRLTAYPDTYRAGIPSDRQSAIAMCAESRQTPSRCSGISQAIVLDPASECWVWVSANSENC